MATANGLITRHVRIHPRAPKKGYRVRTLNVYGIPFSEERGWYTVSFRQDQFEILMNVRNDPENSDSKPVFDICDDAQRKALELAEKRAQEPRGEQVSEVDLNQAERDSRYLEDRSRGRNPVDLTTRDLRSPSEVEDLRDLAPPVPPPPASSVDGAAKPRRGRPPKAKTETE
jgi:hypothetical protein